jgi:hypothetical protein
VKPAQCGSSKFIFVKFLYVEHPLCSIILVLPSTHLFIYTAIRPHITGLHVSTKILSSPGNFTT